MNLKFACLIIIVLVKSQITNAQNWETPIIEGYGKMVHYDKAENIPDPAKVYKIIFHITDEKERDGVNEGLWKIARLINLMGSYGVPSENLKIVAIISGKATYLTLTNTAHVMQEKRDNPNLDLLRKLKAHNVQILVCGQALAKHNFDSEKDLNSFVGVTTSALIAIPSFQMEGYVPMF